MIWLFVWLILTVSTYGHFSVFFPMWGSRKHTQLAPSLFPVFSPDFRGPPQLFLDQSNGKLNFQLINPEFSDPPQVMGLPHSQERQAPHPHVANIWHCLCQEGDKSPQLRHCLCSGFTGRQTQKPDEFFMTLWKGDSPGPLLSPATGEPLNGGHYLLNQPVSFLECEQGSLNLLSLVMPALQFDWNQSPRNQVKARSHQLSKELSFLPRQHTRGWLKLLGSTAWDPGSW